MEVKYNITYKGSFPLAELGAKNVAASLLDLLVSLDQGGCI